MDDDKVLNRIDELVREEEDLLHRHEGDEQPLSSEEETRLAEIRVKLDQAWDFLRQRRALRQHGEDPDAASIRDSETVEGYEG